MEVLKSLTSPPPNAAFLIAAADGDMRFLKPVDYVIVTLLLAGLVALAR